MNMAISNALASVAVKDIKAAVQWYAQVLGRPPDSSPTPELAEWAFPGGGWLQVYALPERAGSCSCTLAVEDVDAEAARLEKLGVATGDRMGGQVRVLMVRDPDGNSIAFSQAPSNAKRKELVAIARAAYDAYVSKDRAAMEALIADDFHFTSPLDNRLDRAAYFARCWPNSKTTQGFEFIHLVRDGERVLVTYEARSAGGRRFRNTEIVTVRGLQIVEVEVYFGWNLPHSAAVGGSIAAVN
jgi:predicted enzyme related to lactoylglutathione lyase/ketosteroid isomerase-like protein